jgi:hypothetical protein
MVSPWSHRLHAPHTAHHSGSVSVFCVGANATREGGFSSSCRCLPAFGGHGLHATTTNARLSTAVVVSATRARRQLCAQGLPAHHPLGFANSRNDPCACNWPGSDHPGGILKGEYGALCCSCAAAGRALLRQLPARSGSLTRFWLWDRVVVVGRPDIPFLGGNNGQCSTEYRSVFTVIRSTEHRRGTATRYTHVALTAENHSREGLLRCAL